MRRSSARAGTLLISVIGGCTVSQTDGPERPELWTLFELREALDSGRDGGGHRRYPQGIEPHEILAPGADGIATLKIIPAFSEGQPAAYVMPEVWAYFDEVWVQPWYVLVTAWDAKSPTQNRAKTADGMNAPPVFDVGPRSLFYSPLWLRYFAVLPAGADPAAYTSAERIFDEKLPIYPNVAWTYSVRPDNVGLGTAPVVHPFLQTPVAGFLEDEPTSWVDGESMGYFDEGSGNFTFRTADLVVDEVPLYELARRGPGRRTRAAGRAARDGKRSAVRAPRRRRARGPAALRRLQPHLPGGRAVGGGGVRSRRVARRGGAARPRRRLTRRRIAAASPPTSPASPPPISRPAAPGWTRRRASKTALGVVNILPTEVTACTPLVFYAGKAIRDDEPVPFAVPTPHTAARGPGLGPRRDERPGARGRDAGTAVAATGRRGADADRPRSRTTPDDGDRRVRPAGRHPDRAAADADGLRRLRFRRRGRQRHQLSARRLPRARRLRRRYLRPRGQLARRRRFDRLRAAASPTASCRGR